MSGSDGKRSASTRTASPSGRLPGMRTSTTAANSGTSASDDDLVARVSHDLREVLRERDVVVENEKLAHAVF
jgi:hypothetical protein